MIWSRFARILQAIAGNTQATNNLSDRIDKMNDAFTDALTNLATSDAADTQEVQQLIAAFQTEVTALGVVTKQNADLTSQLNASTAPSAQQIAAIQQAAADSSARVANMQATLATISPPASTATTVGTMNVGTAAGGGASTDTTNAKTAPSAASSTSTLS